LAVEGGHARPVEWGVGLDGGGHVELTAVEAGGRRDDTLGIEAWGTRDQVRVNLDAVVTLALGGSPGFPHPLTLERSRSYPAWLESIAAGVT
jgi:hypothetical protein